MKTQEIIYEHQGLPLHGFVAYNTQMTGPRPVVMVMHDWSGRNAFAMEKAKMLAALGYIGFAVDLYGEGRVGQTNEEKMHLMGPLMQNRTLLQERLRVHFEQAKVLPDANPDAIGAIGFCFGGLCVLDLARSGVDVKGVVSFHGLLNAPEAKGSHPIRAKVLALHGYNDPMVEPAAVNAFCREMTEKGADWQVHMYGHTQHAFTNPLANDASIGTVYNAIAEARALQAMDNFFSELWG